MAKTKALTAPTSTALTTWDEELAKYAQQTAAQEAKTLFGSMFSIRGGVLAFQGTPIAGNTMEVVLVDHIHERAWYKDKFDADQKSGPHCYAYSRDGLSMRPVEDAFEPVSESCDTCTFNQMGSADNGRGKACREGRRLALLSARDLTTDSVSKAEVGYLKIPPTSIVAFAQYVKGLTNVARRPPFSVVTKITVTPDPDRQVVVNFELVRNLPQDFVQAIIARREIVEKEIFFAYASPAEAKVSATKPQAAQPPQARLSAKKAAGAPPPPVAPTKKPAGKARF